VNITINPEDVTTHDMLKFLSWFQGRRCWFSLVENETYFTHDHVERTRPRRLVATVLRVYAVDLNRVRIDTSEGVLDLSDFFSIEPYERFLNDGKDRYTPA
jgi:hypothetical protein